MSQHKSLFLVLFLKEIGNCADILTAALFSHYKKNKQKIKMVTSVYQQEIGFLNYERVCIQWNTAIF